MTVLLVPQGGELRVGELRSVSKGMDVCLHLAEVMHLQVLGSTRARVPQCIRPDGNHAGLKFLTPER